MKINCKVNTKANPIIESKYVFKAFGNREAPEEEQAYVMVKHLTTKSLNKLLNLTNGGSMDACEVFESQVKSVHHVYNDIVGRDMTKEEIIESPANQMLMVLINEVFAYLLNEVKLNQEEEKN